MKEINASEIKTSLKIITDSVVQKILKFRESYVLTENVPQKRVKNS